MKRLLSTAFAVALLLGLGALAALARGGGGILSPASNVVAAAAQSQTAAAPDAPTVTYKYNDIALVLDVPSITDAASMASYAGSYVKRVLRYNAGTQLFQMYDVGDPDTNFPLLVGDFVFLLVDKTVPDPKVLSLVGDVPVEKSVVFKSLASGTPAKYNFVSLPLDREDLTTASAVAADIGSGVVRVLRFNAPVQLFQMYDVGDPDTDFPLTIGEPFVLLLTTGAPSQWPSQWP